MARRRGASTALVLMGTLSFAPLVTASSHDRPEDGPLGSASAELADLAFELAYDVDSIFRFVADEIRYEPYVGILRGTRGTLDARAGNSVDQALLLAGLLDESLVPFRFARGPLDETAAAALIDSITTDAAEARRIIEAGLVRGLDELDDGREPPTDTGPLSARFDAETRMAAAEAEARLARAGTRLGETVATLEGALDEADIALPADDVRLPRAEADDHTWVQVAFGADWLDLDPTMAGSEPGRIATEVSETLDRLPEELRHRVEFEVLVERVAGGQLVTAPVLEYAAFADEIAGVPVTFSHVTPSAAERFGVTLANVLGEGQLDYRPTLGVGPITHLADEPLAFGLAAAVGGGGLFEDSGLFVDDDASSEDAGPADGEAIAEWLIVRVTSPGADPSVARRAVFDRLPEHVRHGGQATVEAIEPIELIDLEGTGSADYLPMLGIESFAIVTGPTSLADILASLPDDEPGAVALSYHGLRDALGAGMAIDAGARTFVDGPNIVSFSLGVDERAQAADVRLALDIWHRDHGILPLSGPSLSVAEAELVAGVTSHLAERLALEGLDDATDAATDAVGVGGIFEAATTMGIPAIAFHGAIPGPSAYGPRAISLIEDAIAAGDVVVVPTEPVIVDGTGRVGWWRIDPATGTTIDVMDDASGSETSEFTIQVGNQWRWYRCFGSLAIRAKRVLLTAATVVGNIETTVIWNVLSGPTYTPSVHCYRFA